MLHSLSTERNCSCHLEQTPLQLKAKGTGSQAEGLSYLLVPTSYMNLYGKSSKRIDFTDIQGAFAEGLKPNSERTYSTLGTAIPGAQVWQLVFRPSYTTLKLQTSLSPESDLE